MTTLAELFRSLLTDRDLRNAFADDRAAVLDAHGFGDWTDAELNDALFHAANQYPPAVQQALGQDGGIETIARLDLASLGVTGLDDFSMEPSELLGQTSLSADVDPDLDGADLDGTADLGQWADTTPDPSLALGEPADSPMETGRDVAQLEEPLVDFPGDISADSGSFDAFDPSESSVDLDDVDTFDDPDIDDGFDLV